jgi:hypothetical protein
MERIQRLLVSMECPFAGDADLAAYPSAVRTVAWLEDRKVRHLDVADRAALRTPSDAWMAAFESYVRDLGCPYACSHETLLPCIEWLVEHAIAVEYEDYGAFLFLFRPLQGLHLCGTSDELLGCYPFACMRFSPVEHCTDQESTTEVPMAMEGLDAQIQALLEALSLPAHEGEPSDVALQVCCASLRLCWSILAG